MYMGSCHTAVKLSSDGFQEHKKNDAVAVAFFFAWRSLTLFPATSCHV